MNVLLLFLYYSMKKKIRKIQLIFEDQNCARIDLRFQIDLNEVKWGHSNSLGLNRLLE